jgi:predicted RNA-binding protein with PIN domain
MATSIVIDGYNLIHALGLLDRQRGGKVLEQARARLLVFLRKSFAADANVTIVFDARHAPPRVPRQQAYQGLHIQFAAGSESADDRIEHMIDEEPEPRKLIIVSNDHRLQQAAQRRGAQGWDHAQLLDFFEQRTAETPNRPASDEKQSGPLSPAEKAHWLHEFEALEADPELREFFEMDRFDEE